jgi:signal transduction histidine kinase/CheY-like chemotaxis protein
MNEPAQAVIPAETESGRRQRGIELLRSNEALRQELQSLREENTRIKKQLAEAEKAGHADRQSRHAALNLMEDAVAARQAEQRENTERKRVEEELRNADRRKDEFLATLAHELRNPLAPIRNTVQILRMSGAGAGASEHVCEMLDRQVDHMVRLVDDLMEVSRITRGKIELHKERIDLATVVRNAIEISKPLIEADGHELEVQLPAEPAMLDADPVRLAQIFANLLNNAAKYMPDGGRIEITGEREGREAVVSVRDSGIGIAPDALPHVFELFTQGDRVHSRAPGGLGIGLTIVRSLVRLHDGSIQAKSAGTGHGSEFVIRLPLASGDPVNANGAKRQHASSRIARRIMVVDDNRDAATSLGIILRFLGADVHLAHDGQTALDALVSYRPSVVLLDIGMPEMDGYEVARRARQLAEGQGVTLIALTGWGQEEDRRRSAEAGFNYHLVKPVGHAALQALLSSLPEGG